MRNAPSKAAAIARRNQDRLRQLLFAEIEEEIEAMGDVMEEHNRQNGIAPNAYHEGEIKRITAYIGHLRQFQARYAQRIKSQVLERERNANGNP